MTQKTRADYEQAITAIGQSTLHTQEMKTNIMLNVIADILLDIREKLFNPDMKETLSFVEQRDPTEGVIDAIREQGLRTNKKK